MAGDGKEADKAVSAIDAALAADEARKTAERDERERQETIDRYRQKNKPKEQESCCFGRCCGR